AGRPGGTNVPALEADAACAGVALACIYSSSDEYETDVIRRRRAAGAYGVSYQRELVMAAAAVATCLLLYLTR
ncbi:MAG: hypothetical protein ACJ8D0_08455, partial [Xanthobacteraceae bacterium]